MAQNRQVSGPNKLQRPEERGRAAARSPSNGVRANDKYQRIIDAAIEVIAEKGFHNSRVSDIAERAQVADGTVYLYFKSKEQILMTALDSAFESFYRRAKQELTASSDAPTQLRVLA